ncbi:MAG TPA: response regulator [Bryobacteraceae bacterium]|nr:response regulator [Bryobacteraceae bacterium]
MADHMLIDVSQGLPAMATTTVNVEPHDNPEMLQVWLVEDSEADELLMRAALNLDGLDCEFQVSPDGEKAIEYIEALDNGEAWHRPNIVLLDLNLQRKGGARVLEKIRRSQRCAGIPVVVVTSSESPGDRTQASRLGATRYFQKPLDLVEFMKLGPLVREVLNLYAAGQTASS